MGQIIELRTGQIAHGGEALGRHEGRVVFVPYAIPGELVRAEIVEEKERWARAQLIEVLEASPHRVEPPCPYFGPGKCGGCQWQHIAYERQAELKQEIVADQLRRLGRLVEPHVAETVVMADEEGYLDYGYRNNTLFAITGDGHVAYRRAFSHELIAVEHCSLLAERLSDLHAALDVASWPAVREIGLRSGINTGDALVTFAAASDEEPELEIDLPASVVLLTRDGPKPLVGHAWFEEEVNGVRYRISADSYFPANTTGAGALVDIVTAFVDPQPGQVLLDAYAGVGLFTLPLAPEVSELVAIEASPATAEDLAYNARALDNVTVHEGPMEEVLLALAEQAQRFDATILSPDRTGAGEGTIGTLSRLRSRKVVYVSSDPATLARDAVYLTGSGYRLVEAQPVDLFPQSYRVETVALWVRNMEAGN